MVVKGSIPSRGSGAHPATRPAGRAPWRPRPPECASVTTTTSSAPCAVVTVAEPPSSSPAALASSDEPELGGPVVGAVAHRVAPRRSRAAGSARSPAAPAPRWAASRSSIGVGAQAPAAVRQHRRRAPSRARPGGRARAVRPSNTSSASSGDRSQHAAQVALVGRGRRDRRRRGGRRRIRAAKDAEHPPRPAAARRPAGTTARRRLHRRAHRQVGERASGRPARAARSAGSTWVASAVSSSSMTSTTASTSSAASAARMRSGSGSAVIGLPPVTTSARRLPASISSASATAGSWPRHPGQLGPAAPGPAPRDGRGVGRGGRRRPSGPSVERACRRAGRASPVRMSSTHRSHSTRMPSSRHRACRCRTSPRPGRGAARTLGDEPLDDAGLDAGRGRGRASTVNGASAARSAATSSGVQ